MTITASCAAGYQDPAEDLKVASVDRSSQQWVGLGVKLLYIIPPVLGLESSSTEVTTVDSIKANHSYLRYHLA